MKYFFRALIFLAIGFFLVACGQVAMATPISDTSPTPVAVFITTTPVPSPLPTFIVIPTGTSSAPALPTLIPTIEPSTLSTLLSKAFSVQTLEGINGHNIKVIGKWSYGFGCGGYDWLDSSHLLLYPSTGQVYDMSFGGTGSGKNLVTQPAVINVETGKVWLPYIKRAKPSEECETIPWSRDLGILITGNKLSVGIYTFDGDFVSHYQGELVSVSPSRTKIIVADDTIIDLRSNKIVDLDWYMNEDDGSGMLSFSPYWSSDEERVYRCCFHFADIHTGDSFDFNMDDLVGTGKKLPLYSTHLSGKWVRNNNYFLIDWNWVYEGDQNYLPMFDPASKKYYDVREKAGIPPDEGCPVTSISPNGMYVWLQCWSNSYLINLETFNSVTYPHYGVDDIAWSKDGQFAWVKESNSNIREVLAVSNGELKSLNIKTPFDLPFWWHPSNHLLAYISEDKQKIRLVNAENMSLQEADLPTTFSHIVWNPSGDHIALVAEDGSLWQVNYPNLDSLEQLTISLPNVQNVSWSPDGKSISFISNSKIYIVETTK